MGRGLPRGRARRELALLSGGTALAATVVVAGAIGLPLGPLQALAGLFLGLLAPGLALLAAVRPTFLATTARVVLAVPLSLAAGALIGVVLDRTPVGVTPAAAAVASLAVTIGLLLVAWRRPADRGSRGLRRAGGQARAGTGDATSAASPSRLDAWIASLPAPLASLVAHLRDPLFLNAYALGLSGVITSGLGVVYWAVAARLFPADVVGVNASLLSLVTLLASVSQLNLRSGFGRFVPVAGSRTSTLIRWGYVSAIGLALVTGIGLVVLIANAPSLLEGIEVTPLLAWLFPLAVVLWTAFLVQDHALVALRRTAIVPIENGVFALAKILLLFPLASVVTAYGILVSWVVPTAIAVVVVSGWLLARLVPRAQREAAEAAAAGEPDGDGSVTAGGVARYIGADYAGSLLAIGSTSILPVLVLGALGAASSAHFYMVNLIAMATQLVPSVLATSLLVEVASSNATFERDGRRVLRQLAVLLGPIVVVLVVFAEPILGIFGPSYAAEGATALRLMALAGIPYALINLAFIRLRLEGRVRWIVVAQAVLAALLVVPALVVLPALGITGLAVVMLVSQTLVAVVLSWLELRPMFAGALPARWRQAAGRTGSGGAPEHRSQSDPPDSPARPAGMGRVYRRPDPRVTPRDRRRP
jgi:O-antigen/teichoic acid export membrane protein